jgi:tRNA-splicing endonuclease subunit Sen34
MTSDRYLSDAATLRSEHRICGVLTGTLPHLSQQNVFLGLPLVLMPEELVLLVEKREWFLPPVGFGNLHTHPHARVHEKKKSSR